MEARTVHLDEGLALDEGNLNILPNGWYSDPSVFELEQSEIIMRSWQYAGPAGMVSRPGRFMTTQIGALPVLVSRAKDDRLHAMANVCQHRGTVIMEGDGQCKQFKCPYHGWTYDLDGTLLKPLGFEGDIDHAEFSLRKLKATEWGPFVFVAPRAKDEPIDHYFDPLPERLKDTGLDWDSLRLWDRRIWEIEANWKVVTENYIECYHCGHVHPDYGKYVDMDNYSWELGRFYEAQAGPPHPSALKEGYLTPDDAIKNGLFIHVWPNIHIQVYPGDAHNISALNIMPVSPDRTLAQLDHYFGHDASEDEMTRITEYFAQQLEEDWDICPRVHRGLASGAYRAGSGAGEPFAGRLNLEAAAARTEDPLPHFHRLLYEALTARHRLAFGGNGSNGDGRIGDGGGEGWPPPPRTQRGWRRLEGGSDRPIRSGSWVS
jgi:phenylpropionate dioxygenase-like ring-hydroxylating dioxygenase large terminal subunit